MTKDEYKRLATLLAEPGNRQAAEPLSIRLVNEVAGQRDGSSMPKEASGVIRPPASVNPAVRDAHVDVERIVQSAAAEAALLVSRQAASGASRQTQTAKTEDGGSVAATVLKTAGLVTGVGPLVTGLIKLFGGSDNAPAPAPLTRFELPRPVSIEGGLTQERAIVPVGYSQTGIRPAASAAQDRSAAQIQINVSAMDSRSFLDRSDDIARAVRTAMLRSHSLNDVVSEL